MKYVDVQIVNNDQIAPSIFSMTVHAPKICAITRPGQFAMVYLPNGELLLPRPISICDAGDGQLRFVYQVVGAGTKVMSKMKPGIMVQILAPLGKGFFTTPSHCETKNDGQYSPVIAGDGQDSPVIAGLTRNLQAKADRPCPACDDSDTPDLAIHSMKIAGQARNDEGYHSGAIGGVARSTLSKVALVGGGIGTPPLLLLAKALKSQGSQVDAYLGFRDTPILTGDFEKTVDNLHIATDNGSAGHHGNVLEILQQQQANYDEILACGPRPMLNALADFAQSRNIPCQISTEERMACGLGTCVGCVLEVSGTYVRICTEGPVFYSDEVDNHD